MTRLGRLLPDPDPDRAVRLRTAHAQAKAYRLMRQPVPAALALLEREYQRWRKRVQRGLAAEVALPLRETWDLAAPALSVRLAGA